MPKQGHWAKRWEATRLRILERDGWTCQMPRHHAECKGHADSVDHVIPRALGGAHDDDNLRAAFSKCNSKAGGRLRRRSPALPRARASRWG